MQVDAVLDSRLLSSLSHIDRGHARIDALGAWHETAMPSGAIGQCRVDRTSHQYRAVTAPVTAPQSSAMPCANPIADLSRQKLPPDCQQSSSRSRKGRDTDAAETAHCLLAPSVDQTQGAALDSQTAGAAGACIAAPMRRKGLSQEGLRTRLRSEQALWYISAGRPRTAAKGIGQ